MTDHAGQVVRDAYGLFSGLAFVTMIGRLLTLIVHRGLHKFHLGEPMTATRSTTHHRRSQRSSP